MHIEPDETPRQFGEDDELPDDFGSRVAAGPTSGQSAPTRPAASHQASSPTVEMG
jgi:hypothetical protein